MACEPVSKRVVLVTHWPPWAPFSETGCSHAATRTATGLRLVSVRAVTDAAPGGRMPTAIEQPVGDVLDEAARIVVHALGELAAGAAHDAEVCGCAGCKAFAADAARWRAELFSVETVS